MTMMMMTVTSTFLSQYHTHLLQFDGAGNYVLSELDASSRLTLKEVGQILHVHVQIFRMPIVALCTRFKSSFFTDFNSIAQCHSTIGENETGGAAGRYSRNAEAIEGACLCLMLCVPILSSLLLDSVCF